MSKDMKCPFCQQELQEDVGYDGDYSCPNCKEPYFGSPELWQELIRTRKALEMTDTALLTIATNLDKVFPDTRLIFETIRIARKRIAEITALTKGGDKE